MSSGRAHVLRSQSSTLSREDVAPSFAVESPSGGSDDSSSVLKVPNVRSRFLRSSGRTPSSTKEARRCDASARKRKLAKPESIIIISDDESDGSLPSSDPQPFSQPQPNRKFPNFPTLRREWRPPVNLDGPLPQVQPIAEIAPGQDSVVPDPSSVRGLLQQLENGLKQAISIIEVRWGTFMDFYPFISSSLEEIQRVGGVQLAEYCDRKLTYWIILAYRVDRFAFFESCNEVVRLVGEARIKASREGAARERKISEQEVIFANSYERHRHLQRQIDAYNNIADRTGVRTAEGERTLKKFMRECARVQGITEHEKQILEAMRREHAASTAMNSEEELEKKAKVRVQAEQEKELAAIKAELASFTLLDCVD